jgi:hypothetical protein
VNVNASQELVTTKVVKDTLSQKILISISNIALKEKLHANLVNVKFAELTMKLTKLTRARKEKRNAFTAMK